MTLAQALRALGIVAGAEASAIRQAYADRLKALDVDVDPEGYATLRQARDIALRGSRVAAARAIAEADPIVIDKAEGAAEEPGTTERWAYAAPVLPGPGVREHDGRITADLNRPVAADRDPQEEMPDRQVVSLPLLPDAVHHTFAGASNLVVPGDDEAGVTSLPDPGRQLADLLRSAEAAPLSAREQALAQRCLDAILAAAARADLTVQSRIEDWLADLLAESWPRSAPLLQAAASTFGWESERGQLRERGSIRWLNDRLRGLRFQEQLADPRYIQHRAWVELSRPGWSSWIDRRRVSRKQVMELLGTIRQHCPELEQHFDPQRVGSWETAGSGLGIRPAVRWFRYGWIGLIVIWQVTRLLSWEAPSPTPASVPSAYIHSEEGEYEPTRDDALIAAFGKKANIQWLLQVQPTLASSFEARIRSALSNGEGADQAKADAVDLVRRIVYLDGRNADGRTLQEVMRLHLAQTDAAANLGPAACAQFLNSGSLLNIPESPGLFQQERDVASRMTNAGLLTPPEKEPVRHANIPGKLIGQIIQSTGLSDASVRAGLRNQGSDPELCAVRRALLRETLNWRGPRADEHPSYNLRPKASRRPGSLCLIRRTAIFAL